MFYFIESTYKREKTGDALLAIKEVENINLFKLNAGEKHPEHFIIVFNLKSDNARNGRFNTESEIRNSLHNYLIKAGESVEHAAYISQNFKIHSVEHHGLQDAMQNILKEKLISLFN